MINLIYYYQPNNASKQMYNFFSNTCTIFHLEAIKIEIVFKI